MLIAENLQLYCTCKQPISERTMIECQICDDLFHLDCIGLDQTKVDSITHYICDSCTQEEENEQQHKPQNKFKKKTRGRQSINYSFHLFFSFIFDLLSFRDSERTK